MRFVRRLRSFVLRPPAIGPGLKGALTVMAFTDSGWMRRFRVPKLALAVLATLATGLTVATIVSLMFAVWAGSDLRRLSTVERENKSLTTQLQEQAGQLSRLQIEMSRLRELERSLRAVSGLAERNEPGRATGQGGGPAPGPPR